MYCMYNCGEEVIDTLLFAEFSTMQMKNFFQQHLALATYPMPSKPKTSRKEVSDIQRSVVVIWYKASKSPTQIAILEAFSRTTVIYIIKHSQLRPDNPISSGK
jgi:hypothetical protein